MGHQRFRVADVVRDIDQLQRVENGVGFLASAIDLEGEHRARLVHLPLHKIVLRMAGQAGMAHLRHPPLQRLRHLQRVIRLGIGAQLQRLQPLQHHPGVEGRERGPGVALKGQQHRVDEIGAAAHRAGQHAPLPVHQLGGGIGDDIGPQLQRALQRAGGEGVVHHADDTMLARQRADGFDIDDIHGRIGGGLEEEHLGVGADRRLPRIQIAAIDRRRLDTKARQQIIRHPAGGAKGRARHHHVIAHGKLAQ